MSASNSDARSVLHAAQPTDGGVARYVVDLAVSQLHAGRRVAVACPSTGSTAAELAAAGVDVLPWSPRRSPGADLAVEVRELRALVSSVDPAVVHLHSSKAGLAGRLAIRGRRATVFQPHAWSLEAMPRALQGIGVAWERVAAKWTDLLLCVAEQERERGQALGIRGRYAVVPNGVDTLRFPPADPLERISVRRRMNLGSGPLAVCVGRICRQKGQDLLLEAWDCISSSVPDAKLAVVGNGVWKPSVRPSVIFAGAVTDPRDWYVAADVIVCPSRWEGMALVPLEAMATARSVVAADVGGTREAIPLGAGALVPPRDPAALAAAIKLRLADRERADEEGQVGRAHVERHHNLARTLAGVDHAYGLLPTSRTFREVPQ
jgi:glycosyltransferase involved in cell wall biosynthesis